MVREVLVRSLEVRHGTGKRESDGKGGGSFCDLSLSGFVRVGRQIIDQRRGPARLCTNWSSNLVAASLLLGKREQELKQEQEQKLVLVLASCSDSL